MEKIELITISKKELRIMIYEAVSEALSDYNTDSGIRTTKREGIKLHDLNMSTRAYNNLKSGVALSLGIKKFEVVLEDFSKLTFEEVSSFPMVGVKIMSELLDLLEEHNITFKDGGEIVDYRKKLYQ